MAWVHLEEACLAVGGEVASLAAERQEAEIYRENKSIINKDIKRTNREQSILTRQFHGNCLT